MKKKTKKNYRKIVKSNTHIFSNLPDAEIVCVNLKITSVENDTIYGTVDLIFNNHNYRTTYSFAENNCIDIDGILDLESNDFSVDGAFLLGQYCDLAELVLIDYIKNNILLNKATSYYVVSLKDNTTKSL